MRLSGILFPGNGMSCIGSGIECQRVVDGRSRREVAAQLRLSGINAALDLAQTLPECLIVAVNEYLVSS